MADGERPWGFPARVERFKVRLGSEECRAERAAHAAYEAIADFTLALKDARTPAEAWRIHKLLAPLVGALGIH